MRERGSSRFLAAVTTLVLGVVVGCQVPPGPDLVKGNPNASTCPNGNALGNFLADANVAAGFSNSGSVTTYVFASLTNENPVDGVPGLIKYCVYPTPATPPTAVAAQATGANGAAWVSSVGSSDFSFGRPNGTPSNIPLDGTGTAIVIGTATWNVVPSDQTILLHINDATVCNTLYGGDPGTCFVLPGQASACVLDHGETNAAYNAIPFGAADCARSSLGFEATSTSEFGDQVTLKAGTGRSLVSLNVVFSSWACETGHWFDGACSTSAGATFTHPVTANIYSVKDCSGTPCQDQLLATVTTTQTIPFRPSTDPSCAALHTDPTDSRHFGWFNSAVGDCRPQVSMVRSFDFTGLNVTLPDQVIWTVAYNTTHYGAAPIGQGALCFSASGGCPYDSFNVGAQSFPGAPYAGTDVDENAAFLSSTAGGMYCDSGAGGTGSLRLDAGCWNGFRPLGEIITR